MKLKKISKTLEFSGVGIHTGKYSKIILKPSQNYFDINFFLKDKKIPAKIDYVVNTKNATVLGDNAYRISTVEHLLSALYGLNIRGVDVFVIEGEEIPIYDGSSKCFVESLYKCIVETDYEAEIIEIKEKVNYEINNSYYEILPSNKFEIECVLYSEVNCLINQKISVIFEPDVYIKEIAAAKTFCLLKDVEKIRKNGYGLGGNLENTIVIDKDKILNPEKLTYKDEFVRHKILDFLGDFSLLGVYLKVKIKMINPSHSTNIEFCRELKKILNI